MRIRQLLVAAIVVTFSLVAARLVLVQVRTAQSERLDRAQSSVDEMSRGAAGLLVLSQDYLLHASPRVVQQWKAVHDSLARTLPMVGDYPDELHDDIAALGEVAQGLPALFEAVRSATSEGEPRSAAPARRDILASHLVAQTRRISDGAYSLGAELREARRRQASADRAATIVTMVLFAILVTFIAAVVHRRVLRPMERLACAARAVRAGDESARSGYLAKDEFGSLSRTFDEMTDALQERTAGLEATRRDMQSVLDAVPSEISYWDRSLRNRFANPAYRAWFGIDAEALSGAHISILGDVYDQSVPHLQAVLRGEPQVFERMLRRADGAGDRHAVAHYVPDVVDGEVRGFYCCMHDVTQQMQHKERLTAALRENEALLSTIRLHTICSVADASGRIIEANDGFCRISGYSRAELIGQNHRIVNSGLQDRAFWLDMWHTVASGRPWRGEVCNRAKDGSLYWVDSIIAPFVGADGRIDRYISIRFDITTAKLAEQQLRASEAFLDRVGRVAGVGGWTLDIASGAVSWTTETCRLLDMPVGHRPKLEDAISFYAPPARPVISEAIDKAMACGTGWDMELPLVTAAGRSIWARVIGEVEMEDGRPERLVGAFQDVSARRALEAERQRAEADLTRTSTLLRLVLDSASEVSIISADPELTITVFNAGAERLLGYSSDEMVGRTTPVSIHDPGEVQARARELSEQLGRPVEGGAVFIEPSTLQQPREWTYVRKDGGRVAVSLVVTAMHAADGTLTGYLGIAHDVTQRRAYEASLHEAVQQARQASLAKSQFLANMSHEIRTPMNAVIGLSYLLGQTPLDDEQTDHLNKIRLASKSLLSLINDVLDLSKVEAGELTIERAPFALRPLLKELRDVVGVHAQAKGIGLEIDAPEDLPGALEGDATRLSQILTNLLTNAIKFTEIGGVKLVVRQVASTSDGVRLRFAVHDSGIGIAPEVQARLFTPFAQADASMTRRFGGTGLGLSIVKRLATLMDGSVSLRSVVGSGSEFAVELPFSSAAPASPLSVQVAALRPGERGLPGVRVLVTDDSDINLEVARRILELEGARVTLACNGEEACARLRAGPQDFDLVLMDVQMPVRDGYDATRCIRGELGLVALPVLALTAGALTSERQRAAEAGMNDFISKPFDPRSLVLTMRRHLRPGLLESRASSPEPTEAAVTLQHVAWPNIDGVDAADARMRLGGDLGLFKTMLKRLLGEFRDIGEFPATFDAAALPALAARMHKLRGGAGSLGLRAIHPIASRGEAACRSGDVEEARRLAALLGAELSSLSDRASSLLGEPAPSDLSADAATGDGVPPDPALVAELVKLLREQNLSAIDRFRRSAVQLRQLLGTARYERVLEHVDNLQFEAAMAALEGGLVAAV